MTTTVTIGGVTMTGASHIIAEDSIVYENALGQRDVVNLRAISADGTYKPAIGAPVVFSVNGAARFGGNIRQLGTQQFGSSLISTAGCASWEQLFDRRPTGVRSYTNQTLGYIFTDLLTNCMGGDGVSSSIVVTGPVIPSAVFDFATVREAFDYACALASSDTDTYIWDCTPTKVVRLYRSDSFHAPFDITSASTNVLHVGGSVRVGASWSLDKYANRAFVKLGKFVRDPEAQTFTIGTATEFTVDYPIAKAPTVKVDTVSKTVGILDVDTGKDWYWQDGSPVVTRDAGGSGGTSLEITYQGYESKVVGPVQNDTEVAARAAAEGGTGYYTDILESSDPATSADATNRLQSHLDKVSRIPCVFEYITETDGVKAGQWQSIYLPEISVNDIFTIESVTMQSVNGLWFWKVKAIAGALNGDYKTRLREMKGAGGAASGTPGPAGAPGADGTSGGTPPALPTLVVAADVPSERVSDADRVVSTPIYVTVTMPVGHGAEWLDVWFSEGASKEYIGRFAPDDVIKFWKWPQPTDTTSCTVSVTSGNNSADNIPDDAVSSASFTIGKLAAPIASLIPALTLSTSAGGSYPYNAIREDGSQYWQLLVTFDDSAALGVPDAFYTRVTAQDLDSSHNPVGAEVPFFGAQVSGGTHSEVLMGDYGTLGYGYTRSGNVAYLRLKRYVCNRVDQTAQSFANAACATLQTATASYVDVLVATGGGTPAGKMDMRRADPATLNDTLTITATGLGATNQGDGNLILNPTFENGTRAWSIWRIAPTADSAEFVGSSPWTARTGVNFYAIKTGAAGQTAVYQWISVKPNTAYFVSQWWENTGADGSAQLTVNFYQGDSTYISNAAVGSTLSGSTGGVYAQIKGTVTTPANCSQMVVFGIVTGATSHWLLDDVSVEPSTTADTLADLAVSAAKIAAGAVQTAKIADLSIITAKLAAGAVDNGKLAALAVDAAKLADAAVTSVKIANAAVGSAAIANLAVGTAHIQDAGITNAKIANLAVDNAKISNLGVDKLLAGTISASVTMTAPTLSITSGTVTVNIDSSNMIKVTDTAFSRFAKVTANTFRIESTGNSSWYGQLMLGQVQLQDNGGNICNLTPSLLSIPQLPSSNPGVGTKQFWYDPADGNRVKFSG